MNSTPYCTSIQLEHHRGPCQCQCALNSSSCHAKQQFLPDSCSCRCSPSLTSKKVECSKSSVHTWDSETCECSCEQTNSCQTGQLLNTTSCQCEQVAQQECSHHTDSGALVYMVNMIIMGVVTVSMVSTVIYWLKCKDKCRRSNSFSSNNLFHQQFSDT